MKVDIDAIDFRLRHDVGASVAETRAMAAELRELRAAIADAPFAIMGRNMPVTIETDLPDYSRVRLVLDPAGPGGGEGRS